MDIKDILKSGGTVSLDYKEDSKEWVGTAKIRSFSGGFGCKPGIMVEVPTLEIKGIKYFAHDEFDEAISLFKKLVYNRKNLRFKIHEAISHFTANGEDIDLDIERDFAMVENKRLELIKQYEEQNGKI